LVTVTISAESENSDLLGVFGPGFWTEVSSGRRASSLR